MAAKTDFCYGVPVTNESLTYATMAFEHLEGPFRFIRLVQERIKEGTLQTRSPNSAICLLPFELRNLVQQEVTDVELCSAERRFLLRHACADCISTGEVRHRGGRVTSWAKMLECKDCADRMNSFCSFGHNNLIELRRRLLQEYGLDMPSSMVLLPDKPAGPSFPLRLPDAIVFIVLSPSSALPPDSVDAEDHVSYQEPAVDDIDHRYNDGIWLVSLDKPANADQRFRRLLRNLHLTPLKVSDGTLGLSRAADPRPRKRSYAKDQARPGPDALVHLYDRRM